MAAKKPKKKKRSKPKRPQYRGFDPSRFAPASEQAQRMVILETKENWFEETGVDVDDVESRKWGGPSVELAQIQESIEKLSGILASRPTEAEAVEQPEAEEVSRPVIPTVSVPAEDEAPSEPAAGEAEPAATEVTDEVSEPSGAVPSVAEAEPDVSELSEFDSKVRGIRRSLQDGDTSAAYNAFLELESRAEELAAADGEILQQVENEVVRNTIDLFESKIGSYDNIPVVYAPIAKDVAEMDSRVGFLLDRIDGTISYDNLLEVSNLSRFDACRMLNTLLDEGVIISVRP